MLEAHVVIDNLEIARTGAELQGELAVARLERLADSLFDSDGQVRFSIRGRYDALSRPRLEVSVAGELNLRCQRCLGKLPFPLAVESSLLVLSEGSAAGSADIDDLDGVPASTRCDVHALVEDEALLALPYAPRHGDGQCSTALDLDQDRAASPFAALAAIRQERAQK